MELRQKKYEGIKVGKFGITVKRKFEMEAKKKSEITAKSCGFKAKSCGTKAKSCGTKAKSCGRKLSKYGACNLLLGKLLLAAPILRGDEVAEWLRRWTANPLGSARVGSNPIFVAPPHWFYGVMVSTLDFESSDPSSNLGRTWHLTLGNLTIHIHENSQN